MNRARLPLLSLLLLAAAGCSTTNVGVFEDTGLLLAEQSPNDTERVAYRLYPGHGGKPSITRTVTRSYEKPKLLDLVVSDVNANLAKRLGTEPWRGVYVAQVGRDSGSSKAGLVPEDIILRAGDVDLTNADQFDELVGPALVAGEPIELVVKRIQDGRSEVVLSVVPDLMKGQETKTETFELETSKGVQNLTGLQLGALPANLAEEIFGEPEPMTLVTGVVTGSPAYFAGLRRGDRVLEAADVARPGLDAVRSAVRARSGAAPLSKDELDVASAPIGGPAGDDLVLEVDGPLGPHSAAVTIESDLLERTHFDFPILFEYTSTTDATSWSFLDFIFQFGGNYDGAYLPSATRSPQHESKLSLLPLGMFEFERNPRRNAYSFFWFIDFETSND